ncbi:hypothetical protein ERJ75_001523100 [Trypanosoma vivax]|uniref:Uncharacterized protein n=1 Tax=Trypanosoma vivax (strain Y486) TaxID=1055687 RepID=G0UBA8_TRYVY|nr:hypothetical protein TRVL_03190 [Trypanosoma vivax]KAH8606338.1 hypothetical protein ERJ75_001523100 [Trypanosoma vivax]CCC53095.1 conserved hypothetical protein [Trypanosoma vivax Y486]
MSEAVIDFLDNWRILPACKAICSTTVTVYRWACDCAWPVYTTGLLVSVLSALAAAHEKQMIADNLYGSDEQLQSGDRSAEVERAKKLLQEEVSRGVKQVVWMMPRDSFMREYNERQ